METYVPDARSSAIFRKFVDAETSAETSARFKFWRDLPDLPARPHDGHKGTFGVALIVGGSRGMSGAVALAGSSALVCGAGLTRLVVPDAIQDTVAQFHEEYTTIGAPSDAKGRFSERALDVILAAAQKATVVAVGPGLGRSDALDRMVERLYLELPQRAIFDADALNALASVKFFDAPWFSCKQTLPARVLTPHPGEFERLFEVRPTSDERVRGAFTVVAAEEIAFRRQRILQPGEEIEKAVLLLKGYRSVIARSAIRDVRNDPTSEPRVDFYMESSRTINETGSPNLATGGSGDALTGIIAGLIAQGLDAWDATRLGAALHGLSAELRAALVPRGGTASDIPRFLPCAMAVYEKIRERVK